jgi:hypothetical protein
MNTPYSEVPFQRGRTIAADYYLPHRSDQNNVRTHSVEITTAGTPSVAAVNRVLRGLGLPLVSWEAVAPLARRERRREL